MLKIKMLSAAIYCLVVACFGAELSGQELPVLKRNLESETSSVAAGYVDLSVLQSQVDRNTKAIEKISKLLKPQVAGSEIQPVGNGSAPLFYHIPPTPFWHPRPLTVQSQRVVPAYEPATIAPVFAAYPSFPNSSFSVPVTAIPEFSVTEIVSVQDFRSPSVKRLPIARINRRVANSVPRCRIINGRKSCN